MLLGIVEADALLQMCARQQQFSLEEENTPQLPVRNHKESSLLSMLRQLEELLSKFPRPLQRAPYRVKPYQPHQNPRQVRHVSHLLTELPGSGVGLLHFRGGRALKSIQCRTHGA